MSDQFQDISDWFIDKKKFQMCFCVFLNCTRLKDCSAWSVQPDPLSGLQRPLVVSLATEVLSHYITCQPELDGVQLKRGLIKINMALNVRWLISWLKRHMLTYISAAFIANCCVQNQETTAHCFRTSLKKLPKIVGTFLYLTMTFIIKNPS